MLSATAPLLATAAILWLLVYGLALGVAKLQLASWSAPAALTPGTGNVGSTTVGPGDSTTPLLLNVGEYSSLVGRDMHGVGDACRDPHAVFSAHKGTCLCETTPTVYTYSVPKGKCVPLAANIPSPGAGTYHAVCADSGDCAHNLVCREGRCECGAGTRLLDGAYCVPQTITGGTQPSPAT